MEVSLRRLDNFPWMHVLYEWAGWLTGHNDWNLRRVFTTDNYVALTLANSSLGGDEGATQVRDVLHFADITECTEFAHGIFSFLLHLPPFFLLHPPIPNALLFRLSFLFPPLSFVLPLARARARSLSCSLLHIRGFLE